MSFQKFSEMGIEVVMLSHGASKCCITFVIDDSVLEKALHALHVLFYGR